MWRHSYAVVCCIVLYSVAYAMLRAIMFAMQCLVLHAVSYVMCHIL